MTLRQATPDDASSLAALSIEVWLGTYLKHGISGFFADYVLEEFTADKMRRVVADPAEFVMVSQNDEGIDGFIRVSTGRPTPAKGGSDCEILTFYVQPRHHGRGVGRALLGAALQHCRDVGAESV